MFYLMNAATKTLFKSQHIQRLAIIIPTLRIKTSTVETMTIKMNNKIISSNQLTFSPLTHSTAHAEHITIVLAILSREPTGLIQRYYVNGSPLSVKWNLIHICAFGIHFASKHFHAIVYFSQ